MSDYQVTAIERCQHGRKPGKLQDQFKEVLHKQCPIYPKSNHTLFQCTTIRKSLKAPPLNDDEEPKKEGKEDEDDDQQTLPGTKN